MAQRERERVRTGRGGMRKPRSPEGLREAKGSPRGQTQGGEARKLGRGQVGLPRIRTGGWGVGVERRYR